MSESIKPIEGDLEIPIVKILTGRGFITGKSGGGKSNTTGKICEEILDEGYPILIVDTDGEYYGLKEKYEILHVGADEECDLQVNIEHAEKLADLALNNNIPIILDVSGYLNKEEKEDIIKETLNHLYAKEKKLKKPFLVIVEEVHEYIPEKGGQSECGEVIVRIGKRGRKRGLGILTLSQRPASVDKDFITQCDWRVWHRLDWNNDVEVVRKVLGKDYSERVQELEIGEAILEADWLDERAVEVKFKKKSTFDAGATPDLEDFERPELKAVSKELVDELQKISERERKKKDTVEKLKRKLEEKDEEIENLEEELSRAKDISDMAKRFTDALSKGGNSEIGEKVEEIRQEKNEEILQLKKSLETYKERLSEAQERLSEVEDLEEYKDKAQAWESKRDVVAEALSRIEDALEINPKSDADERLKKKIESQREKIKRLQEQKGSVDLDEEFSEAIDFVKNETVKNAIKRAADTVSNSPEHTWDVVTVLVKKGSVTSHDIVPLVDVSKVSVNRILKCLSDERVVKKESVNGTPHYSLNREGLKEIIRMKRERREIESFRNEVNG